MSVLALHFDVDGREIRRYGAAAIAIVLAHLVLLAIALVWYARPQSAGVSVQPIFVELAPPPTAERPQQDDLAPGPQVQEAEAPPETPKTEMVEQQPPTPLQEAPIVAAPQRVEQKAEPSPRKPPVPVEAKRPVKKRLVDPTTAAKAERTSRDAPSPASNASSAAATAAYGSILAAHLQRFKQYPPAAREKREQGTTSLSFTVTRNGRVTSSRLVRSSGFAALDQETLALIRRAQPLPSFPPEMREASTTFTVPFSFTMR